MPLAHYFLFQLKYYIYMTTKKQNTRIIEYITPYDNLKGFEHFGNEY